ncbi:MAG: hypothetical protein K6V36_07180 [Anaerolineae bacterium]|nr:hypothetical protein [Anaerolineae bacterium]
MSAEGRAGEAPPERDSWVTASGQVARWIGVELELHAPRTWHGPTWAMLGGVLSSGDVPLTLRSLVLLTVAWLVSEPLLGSLLLLALQIGRMRQAGRGGAAAEVRWTIPYARRDSPAQRALDRMAARTGRALGEWRALQGAGERWLLLALITAVLSAVAGGYVPLVVLAALAVTLLTAVGRPPRSGAREALAAGQFMVAWLVGRSTFADPDYHTLLAGLALAVVWYAWTRRPPLAAALAAGQLLLAGLLAALHAPLLAGAVLLLTVPPLVLLPEGPSSQRTFLQHTQPYLMASLLAVAWGLVWPV